MCPWYINVSKYISVTITYLGQYSSSVQCIPSSMTTVSSIIEKDCYYSVCFLKAKFEAFFCASSICHASFICHVHMIMIQTRTRENMASYIYSKAKSRSNEDDNLDSWNSRHVSVGRSLGRLEDLDDWDVYVSFHKCWQTRLIVFWPFLLLLLFPNVQAYSSLVQDIIYYLWKKSETQEFFKNVSLKSCEIHVFEICMSNLFGFNLIGLL